MTSTVHVVVNNHQHHVQDHTKKETVVANKHTGFPEPFCEDRNTTLPHPEADTSPNATIEAPDDELSRIHSRGSIFARRHHPHSHHHLWHHEAMPEKMRLYDNITYADDEHPVDEKASVEHAEDRRRDSKRGGFLKTVLPKS